MQNKVSFSSYFALGLMLFALFFGAGNLIFPAQLGQNAGESLWPAAAGFLITGVGLPLLGVLAIAYSGTNNLQELSSRVHPAYGIAFTSLLYLSIGPFFAAPRTGTVAYEVAIAPYVGGNQQLGLLIFTILFFAAVLIFSLYPGRIVDNVGKILAPGIVVLLVILLAAVVINPMGAIQPPQEAFQSGPFVGGFLEGYNTMDALASLVFAIIVINAVKGMGIKNQKTIIGTTVKAGVIAVVLLGVLYTGIAYLGAASVEVIGIQETGGPVLNAGAEYYFGTFGAIFLAVAMILACMTTAIGLVTANAAYFNQLIPRFKYRPLVIFFTLLTFVIANFGLSNIITFSQPVLMFLYPLAIVLMILAFVSPLFKHARFVYVSTIGVTFLISIFDGLTTLYDSLGIEDYGWMQPILDFYDQVLPLYSQGLGWLVPALVVMVITGIIARFTISDKAGKEN